MIRLIGFLILLGPNVWLDLKERKIPVIFCLCCTVLSLILNLCFSWTSLWEEIAGAVFGGAFFLISFFSKGALGMGDAWLMLAGSAWCGFFGAMEIAFAGLLLAGISGAAYVLITKKSWKTRLPFAPFYAAAAIGWSALLWISEGKG